MKKPVDFFAITTCSFLFCAGCYLLRERIMHIFEVISNSDAFTVLALLTGLFGLIMTIAQAALTNIDNGKKEIVSTTRRTIQDIQEMLSQRVYEVERTIVVCQKDISENKIRLDIQDEKCQHFIKQSFEFEGKLTETQSLVLSSIKLLELQNKLANLSGDK